MIWEHRYSEQIYCLDLVYILLVLNFVITHSMKFYIIVFSII